MTRKLEELLNLPPLDDGEDFEEEKSLADLRADRSAAIEEAQDVLKSLSTAEKLDLALTGVTGLLEHDDEMDDIAKRALDSYRELNLLGQNMPDMHAGKIYEVAATMLKTAMEAKDAKVNKKLKMLDLQLKKLNLEQKQSGPNNDDSGQGGEFDRNELLKHILVAQNSTETDNSDK